MYKAIRFLGKVAKKNIGLWARYTVSIDLEGVVCDLRTGGEKGGREGGRQGERGREKEEEEERRRKKNLVENDREPKKHG